MAITERQIEQFNDFCGAVREDNVCLIETTDKTGATCAVICVALKQPGHVLVAPYAKLFAGDPDLEINRPEGAADSIVLEPASVAPNPSGLIQ